MSENKNAKTSADGPEYERGFVDGMQRQMQLHVNRVIKAEPTAWISDSPTKGNGKQLHWTKSEAWRWSSNITPLYTATQKKQWVGLTHPQIHELDWPDGVSFEDILLFVRSIEQALKEKNT